ncbi:hypothetical protein SGLAM104S_06295 [Streptomyces glaucescens]
MPLKASTTPRPTRWVRERWVYEEPEQAGRPRRRHCGDTGTARSGPRDVAAEARACRIGVAGERLDALEEGEQPPMTKMPTAASSDQKNRSLP